MEYFDVTIRKFKKEDILNKVKWINDNNNNTFLHYNIPLTIEGTKEWFKKISESTNRYDAVIICNNKPIGVIGLINIDKRC